MKRLMVALGIFLLTGCGGAAFIPAGAPVGIIQSTSTAKLVSSNPIGPKKGEACAISILQLVTVGDASVATAARNGGIGQIGAVDNSDFNLFGLYSRHCAEVSGM